jgi:uncharacterized protein YbjT (DUF2867 family)
MKNVILFGASGHLGKAISRELKKEGFNVTAVVRKQRKDQSFANDVSHVEILEDFEFEKISNLMQGKDIVISALGKSVSPFAFDSPTFYEVDYLLNQKILEVAQSYEIKKMIYISAFHAEKYQHLTYFKVHHDFSNLLISSKLDYSIIKPPALFSAFRDFTVLAQKGLLFNIGKGDKKTNPIFEGDLAKIVVKSILKKNVVIEAGGKFIYSRKELNEIILKAYSPSKKLQSFPISLFRFPLPFLKIANKNSYDKLSFFFEVLENETIAPQLGDLSFEDYIKEHLKPMN